MNKDSATNEDWYFKVWVIVLAILFAGPLGLIPLWFKPKTNLYLKIFVSVIVLGFTVWLTYETVNIYQELVRVINDIRG